MGSTISSLIDTAEMGDSATADEPAKVEPELTELAGMKLFYGFTFAEIAVLRNLSKRTVQRSWEKARIDLHRAGADIPL